VSIFTYAEDISYINDKLSAPAILGQAAEEANEFGKACLKLQRILMDENPTPVTEPEARAALVEEVADVYCSLEVLTRRFGIDYLGDIRPLAYEKAKRWTERIRKKLADVTDINVGDKKPMPLSYGAVKALNGEKVHICYMAGWPESKCVPYYGQHEQYIEEYNGMLRATDLPLQYYGREWVAYRNAPGEVSHDEKANDDVVRAERMKRGEQLYKSWREM